MLNESDVVVRLSIELLYVNMKFAMEPICCVLTNKNAINRSKYLNNMVTRLEMLLQLKKNQIYKCILISSMRAKINRKPLQFCYTDREVFK